MKWFNHLSRPLQIILLIIPFVGWIVELVVRWDCFLKKSSFGHLLIALFFTIFGVAWLPCLIDCLSCAFEKHLLFAK